jgi:hydroxysqualene synthase
LSSDNSQMSLSAPPSPLNAPKLSASGVNHYENFPVATWLCPPNLRPAIAAIYWFARTADDLADEGSAEAQVRLHDLAQYRADLALCASSGADSGRWPGVFAALGPVIAQHALPVNLLADLLSAFEQDVVKTRYANQAELLDYCARSANPVGRLLLCLYGVTEPLALRQSDCICSALQLINFWQDVGEDIERGRIYLPGNSWRAFGVREADLLARVDTLDTMKLIAHNADFARAAMLKGLELPSFVAQQLGGFSGWRAALELRCVIQGGLRILEKIARADHRVLRMRPAVTKWDAVVIFWRALTS